MVSKEEVKHLADLSRLSVSADELDRMAQDLSGILGHFKELEAADTAGVESVSGGTELANVLREDKVVSDFNRQLLIDSFPKEKDGYNSVPPVFDN